MVLKWLTLWIMSNLQFEDLDMARNLFSLANLSSPPLNGVCNNFIPSSSDLSGWTVELPSANRWINNQCYRTSTLLTRMADKTDL